jgi:hypothetical protein
VLVRLSGVVRVCSLLGIRVVTHLVTHSVATATQPHGFWGWAKPPTGGSDEHPPPRLWTRCSPTRYPPDRPAARAEAEAVLLRAVIGLDNVHTWSCWASIRRGAGGGPPRTQVTRQHLRYLPWEAMVR